MKYLFPGALVLGLALSARAQTPPVDELVNGHQGRTASGAIILPQNQMITPAGVQVELPGMRPQAIALSPDGKLLVTSGKTHELALVDPATGKKIGNVDLPGEDPISSSAKAVSSHILKPDDSDQVSFTGLIFSPDGSRLFLSNVRGSIKVFSVDKDHKVAGIGSIPLPAADAPGRAAEIPAGMTISRDGTRLYVTGNLSNRLLEFGLPDGNPLRTFDVGTAPYDVVIIGRKAYVSNWGGRRPDSRSIVGPAGRGTRVRVDAVRFIADEGSVSVIDLDSGKATKEILVGMHSSALLASPEGRYLFVANPSSDTVSVIDSRKDEVTETISMRWHPNDFYGAVPNALAIDPSGKTLYVCNGGQNAVAVVAFRPGRSKVSGLVPTGWFPGAIAFDAARKQLDVANVKGITIAGQNKPVPAKGYTSHQSIGTLSLLAIPDRKQLAEDTKIVARNYRQAVAEHAHLPARPDVKPHPVPERVGEPSVFKHVVYLIKENRSYDQVLGDVKEGNGNPKLCVFGERFTPNQHKMVREFTLCDNLYCSGILSADGHQWADTAFATDYMEKSFAGFPRSYPDGMEETDIDALAYSPTGFIWDNALAHGKTLRDYGEFTMGYTRWKDPKHGGEPAFADQYANFIQNKDAIEIGSVPAVESLRNHMMTNTVGWDLSIPDVFRAAQFIKELKQFEAKGECPQLMIICLPNDHTSGTGAGKPTPAAQVADNDLAFGRIVEAISHSSFWKDTCIFAVEDDPQAGWDHVSGYRTTGYVVSAYTKRHAVVSVNYNQTAILRTMELILGLPPMNQMDATANPMFECFSETPDFTPFDTIPNNIPLDQMNPQPATIKNPVERHDALASARLPLAKPDQCNEDVLNHILWRAQMGTKAPYPEWAITVKDAD